MREETEEINPYEIAYKASISSDSREQFWRNEATAISWFKFPQTILDSSNPPFYRWFPDG